MGRPQRKINFIVLILLAIFALGILVYSNTFYSPFVYDDKEFIVDNRGIRDIHDFDLLLYPRFYARIASFFTFFLNYQIHGLNVFGYHVTNLAIHLANTFCMMWFLSLLFNTEKIKKTSFFQYQSFIVTACGFLFLSHPIQTQAVTFVSQRFEILATFFYVSSLCFYIKCRESLKKEKGRNFLIFILLAVLALMSKETAYSLPFAVLLIEFTFLKKSSRKIWTMGFLFFVFAFIFVIYSQYLFQFWFLRNYDIPVSNYFLTQFRVIMKYIGLLFFPINQNLDYDFSLSQSFLEPSVLLSFSCILVILTAAVFFRKKFPLISFGIFWFFLTLSVTSSIIPLTDVINEHRVYLPSIGFFIFFSSVLLHLLKNVRMFMYIIAALVLVFSILTYERNQVWASEITLWQDVTQKSPNKFRGYSNLGRAYREIGDYEKAFVNYDKALSLLPKNLKEKSKFYVNLGTLYGSLGNRKEALNYFLKAIALNQRNAVAHSNAGFVYAQLGDYENALQYARKGVRLDRRHDHWNNLGVVFLRMKKYKNAENAFRKALKLNPDFKVAKENLNLLERMTDDKAKYN